MTSHERRATASLTSVFALRMLGLFLVLPVFALEAASYTGGLDAARVGFAMGVYGLTQACLQIPFGIASDRFGRKPVMLLGLAIFALGSVVAAMAASVDGLLVGRALQGAGAISAAVTALLADMTRSQVRTKSMALVGISIACMFMLSLALAPVLASHVGLSGLFALTAALAVSGMAVVTWWVPSSPVVMRAIAPANGLWVVLADNQLWRLSMGSFSLHAIQLAMWLVLPGLLVDSGLNASDHWQVYVPAVVASLLVLGGVLFRLERQGYLRAVLLGSVACLLVVQLGLLAYVGGQVKPSLWLLGVLLFGFFLGFNALEASQPSLASKFAQTPVRGAALGVFNTCQSLGFFAGGAAGGAILAWGGATVLLAVTSAWLALWLAVAWGLQPKLAIY
jgi:MFS family permease